MTARFPRSLLHAAVLFVLATSMAAPAYAQARTRLNVTGLPKTVTTTTADDFVNGFVPFGAVSYTADLRTNGGGGFSPRRVTVSVRCGTPCPSSGTLSLTAVQWRRGDNTLGAWTTLTTSYAQVEQRIAVWRGANDPWTNTIDFRYALSWTGTPPTAATSFRLQFQLTVAAP